MSSFLIRLTPARSESIALSTGGYLALMSGLVVRPEPNAIASFYGYGDIVGDWYSKPCPPYSEWEPKSKDEIDEIYSFVNRGVLSESVDMHRLGFYHYCRQYGLWPNEVGGWDPQSQPEKFVPYCPEQNVSPSYPPTILLHGTDDTDVPHSLSVQMAKSLKEIGASTCRSPNAQ